MSTKKGKGGVALERKIEEWRSLSWPPSGAEQLADLPLYICSHEVAQRFGERLADVQALISSHVLDTGNMRIPRWMKIPKLRMGCQRLVINESEAKISERFGSVDAIEAKVGMLGPAERNRIFEKMAEANEQSRDLEFVCHKPFNDVRAYVYRDDIDRSPERVWFASSGLVVGIDSRISREQFYSRLQDRRWIDRQERNDAYSNPIAVSNTGWRIYALDNTR